MSSPTLLDIPDHFETERLLMRLPRPGDAEAFHQAVTESLDELRTWLYWAAQPQTLESSERYVRGSVARFIQREGIPMLIIRKEDGYLLGTVTLHHIRWEVPAFEIGYWLRSSGQGKGYMTEAVSGMTKFAFDVLHAERVEILCDPRNQNSANVARRCGYTYEGELRSDMLDPQGLPSNSLVFAMIREEYARR